MLKMTKTYILPISQCDPFVIFILAAVLFFVFLGRLGIAVRLCLDDGMHDLVYQAFGLAGLFVVVLIDGTCVGGRRPELIARTERPLRCD